MFGQIGPKSPISVILMLPPFFWVFQPMLYIDLSKWDCGWSWQPFKVVVGLWHCFVWLSTGCSYETHTHTKTNWHMAPRRRKKFPLEFTLKEKWILVKSPRFWSFTGKRQSCPWEIVGEVLLPEKNSENFLFYPITVFPIQSEWMKNCLCSAPVFIRRG